MPLKNGKKIANWTPSFIRCCKTVLDTSALAGTRLRRIYVFWYDSSFDTSRMYEYSRKNSSQSTPSTRPSVAGRLLDKRQGDGCTTEFFHIISGRLENQNNAEIKMLSTYHLHSLVQNITLSLNSDLL